MLNNTPIGIMQGRISDKPGQPLQSFPYKRWQEEFANASELGYELIEWLIDDKDNPIATVSGRTEIKALSEQYDIIIRSICAHIFINGSLLCEGSTGESAINYLSTVLEFANQSNVEFVILPAMEGLSLKTEVAKCRMKIILSNILNNDTSTMLLLESDLPGIELRKFIEDVGLPRLGVLYDFGNAQALGFDVMEDMLVLDGLIREVHIKDRRSNNGASYRLGDGDVQFPMAAQILKSLSWNGPIVLETPIYNNWRQEAVHNLIFTRNWRDKVIN
jgi:L-ribulose-5-phosphate 3-epimerase